MSSVISSVQTSPAPREISLSRREPQPISNSMSAPLSDVASPLLVFQRSRSHLLGEIRVDVTNLIGRAVEHVHATQPFLANDIHDIARRFVLHSHLVATGYANRRLIGVELRLDNTSDGQITVPGLSHGLPLSASRQPTLWSLRRIP